MPDESLTAASTSPLGLLARRTDLPFAISLLAILAVLVLPIPTGFLSVLLAANLSLAMVILLVAIHGREPLEFSTFPSLLLVTTLFRLALNVATTRQILLNASGGSLIESFGQFVVGGNLVVGMVIFLILIVIQLVVITKGAGRISEVAARFTLDAMPGKQMAIDADLNAGLISEAEARERRDKIGSEAEFYGAMDGASKFVKGDAIAGLIITGVNIVAGIIIGSTMMGMSVGGALERFALLTVGDGLVTAIPSLLIAISSGMLVTKARTESNIGQELPRQFFVKPKALLIGACMVATLGIVPGMPLPPFAVLALLLLLLYRVTLRANRAETAFVRQRAEVEEQSKQPEEKVEDLLTADRIGVEIGYHLIPLVDKERGGTLLERITRLRQQLAHERGLLIPPIRIKDNIQLDPGHYRILIYGDAVGEGDLMPDRLLAIDGGTVSAPIEGIETTEPAFGLDALWIAAARRGEAEGRGYAVTDPASVFITHLTQVLQRHADTLLNREDVQALLDSLKRSSPVLVKDIEDNVKLGLVQKVLGTLLAEGVSIANLEKILEGVSDNPEGDPVLIAEGIRAKLGRTLVAPHLDADGRLHAVILHPLTEQRLAQSIVGSQQGAGLGIAPAEANHLMDQLGAAQREAGAAGHDPVLLTTAPLRRQMHQITSRFYPELPVISYSELPDATDVEVVATLTLDPADRAESGDDA